MALPVLPHPSISVRSGRTAAALSARRGLSIPASLVLLLVLLFPSACGEGPGGDGPAGTGAAAGDREAPQHILLITLDALRADHLGCYGYPRPTSPAIDRLAAGGVLFSEAQVPRGQTWPSLSSLLTGRYPLQHGTRSNATPPDPGIGVLPQILRAGGYTTGAFLSNYGDAVSSKAAFGLDRLVRANLSSRKPQDRWDDETTRLAQKWITAQRDRPAFIWVHLMNPHRPYDPPGLERELLVGDSYQGWLDDEVSLAELKQGIRDGRIPLTEQQFDEFARASFWKPWIAGNYLELMQQQDWKLTFDQLLDLIVLQRVDLPADDLEYIRSRYDAEIRAADRCVGRLLDSLDALGLADRTLVILAADHGDELYDRSQYIFHSASIYQGVLHVPLILRWPGRIRPSTLEPGLAEITDLLPTILDAAGLAAPAGLPGHSLLGRRGPGDGRGETVYAFAEVAHLVAEGQDVSPPMDAAYSVRDGRWKLVFNPSGGQPRFVPHSCLPDRCFPIGREELYDLELDPGEQCNLLAPGRRQLGELALDAAGGGGNLDAAEYLLAAEQAYTRLFAELAAWLERNKGPGGAKRSGQVTDTIRKRLAALGYLEDEPLTAPPPAAGATGREMLVRTALQLAGRPPAAGEEASRAGAPRARDLASRARARLDELEAAPPAAE